MDNTFFVGRQITHPSVALTNGNFSLKKQQDELIARNYDTLEDAGAYSLEDVGGTPAAPTQKEQVPSVIHPNLEPGDASTYARYGSLELFFRVMVTDIILNFPGALISTLESGAMNTALGYWYNTLNDESYLEIPESAIVNPFEVNYISADVSASHSRWQDFLTYFLRYDVLNVATGQRFPIVSYQAPNTQDLYLRLYTKGQVFPDNTERRSETLYLIPSQPYYTEFIDSLNPLQRYMLNAKGQAFTLRFPGFDTSGNPLEREEELSWRQIDFYHPDVTSDAFLLFFDNLLRLGRDYDLSFGNLLAGRYAVSSLQEQDYSGEMKVGRLLNILGRSFDAVKRQIDGLPTLDIFSYSRTQGVPDGMLNQQLSGRGWTVQGILEDPEKEVGLWRMIGASQQYLLSAKGTRKGLEDMIALLGMIPGLITVNEYIYSTGQDVIYPKNNEEQHFQQLGDQDGGDAYLRILAGEQQVDQIADQRKSWAGTSGRQDSNWGVYYQQAPIAINSKLLDLTVNRDKVIAIFSQGQSDCDELTLQNFTDLVDRQVERFKNVYLPFLRAYFLPATVIFSDGSASHLHIEYQMFTATPGGADGGVRIIVEGGTGPYSFEWEDQTVTQAGERFDFAAGLHYVWVRDSSTPALSRRFDFEVLAVENLCFAWRAQEDSAYCVTEDLQSTLHLDGILLSEPGIGPNCPARAEVQVLGQPHGNIYYEWIDGSGQVIATTASATLPVGTQDQAYTVVVWDDLRSKGHLSEQVVIAANPITVETTVNESTFGGSNGSIQATAAGGSGTYSYAWVGPDGFTASTAEIVALTSGVYNLTVTDDCGNQTVVPVDLADPCASADPISIVASVQQASFGAGDGSITLDVSGGSGVYSFSWVGPNGYVSQQEDIIGLEPGDYTITITDECGMTYSEVITLPEEDPCLSADPITLSGVDLINISRGILISGYSTNVSYSNYVNFSSSVFFDIDVSISPAADQRLRLEIEVAAVYLSSGGSEREEVETFNVWIDQGLDWGSNNFGSIRWFSGDFVRLETKRVRVYGNVSGQILIDPQDVNGGIPPYTYRWERSGSEIAQGLNLDNITDPGSYTLKITDSCGETFTQSYNINEIR